MIFLKPLLSLINHSYLKLILPHIIQMEEISNERESRSMVQTDDRRLASHTSSPPSLTIRQRTSSTETQSTQKKNYHERNMGHIKALKEKNQVRKQQLEDEKTKLEQTRERLAKIIMKRSEALKKAKEENEKKTKEEEDQKKAEEVIQEEPEEDYYKKKNVSAYYRSRYASLLKTIQDTNKNKQQLKEIEQQKKEKYKKKLKEEMGLGNITSKLFNPTVSSLINSNNVTENEIVELKGQKYAGGLQNLKKAEIKKGQNKPPEDEKEKQKIGREAAEKIKKRAQDHLIQLADKKEQEARKEEKARLKEEKLKASLREAVLNKAKTTDFSKEESKDPIKDESSSDEVVPKKVKKSDESALKRLSQAPKRWSAHSITDLAQFRKKYKLSEKDKIFIVLGGYPDIRRALLARSTSYLGRLVREP
jgi:hypothetical protein